MNAHEDLTPQHPDDHAREASATSDSEPGGLAALHDPWSYVRLFSVAIIGLTIDLWSKQWAFTTMRQGAGRVLVPNVLELQVMLNKGALFGIGQGQTALFLVASLFALVLVLWMFAQSSPRRWTLQIALGAILAGALGNLYDRATVQLLEQPFLSPRIQQFVFVQVDGEDEHGTILREYPSREGGLEWRMRGPEQSGGSVIVRPYPRSAPGRPRQLERMPAVVGCVRDFIKIPTRWFGGAELWPWVFNVADMLLVGGVSILAFHLFRDRKTPPQAAADQSVDANEPNGVK